MQLDVAGTVMQVLAEMDKTISDTAARIEHCRALVREADRLLNRMRLQPSVDEVIYEQSESNARG